MVYRNGAIPLNPGRPLKEQEKALENPLIIPEKLALLPTPRGRGWLACRVFRQTLSRDLRAVETKRQRNCLVEPLWPTAAACGPLPQKGECLDLA